LVDYFNLTKNINTDFKLITSNQNKIFTKNILDKHHKRIKIFEQKNYDSNALNQSLYNNHKNNIEFNNNIYTRKQEKISNINYKRNIMHLQNITNNSYFLNNPNLINFSNQLILEKNNDLCDFKLGGIRENIKIETFHNKILPEKIIVDKKMNMKNKHINSENFKFYEKKKF